MKQAYRISQGTEECAAAREQFEVIVARLQSAPVLGMEHGEVEGLISREGTEFILYLPKALPPCNPGWSMGTKGSLRISAPRSNGRGSR